MSYVEDRYDLDLGESPSYTDLRNNFLDKEVEGDEALAQAIFLQRKYPGLVSLGGINTHPDIFGYKDLRNTSQALDFAADPETVRDFVENTEDPWDYEGSIVGPTESYTGEDGEEWMTVVLPCDQEIFDQEGFEDFCVDPSEVVEPERVSTRFGDLSTVSPGLTISSKLRRYAMRKEEGSDYKKSDLVDVANIVLRSSVEGDLFSNRNVAYRLDHCIGSFPDYDEFKRDVVDSINDVEMKEELTFGEVSKSLDELEEILEASDLNT